MIGVEPLLDGLLLVVVPLVEFGSAFVAYALFLRGVVGQVIYRVAGGVGAGAPLGEPADEDLVCHIEVQCEVDVEFAVEGLGLLHGPGESVEDDAGDFSEALDLLLHEVDDDLVGHESARIHVGLSFLSQFGAVPDGLPQHVAGGQSDVSELGLELLSLSSFSSSRRSKKDDHRFHSGCLE